MTRSATPAVISSLAPLIVSFAMSGGGPALAGAQRLPEAVTFTREMVVTQHPLATAAGERILGEGGTAADAMVAVQAVLGLVEPQSSGLGGGGFVVYYDAETGVTTTVDGRETAPASATPDRFAGLAGGFVAAWQSGLSVGVPGTPRMMEFLHESHGRMEWGGLFETAIDLAEGGFALSERTSDLVDRLLSFNPSCDERLIFRDPTAFAYFAHPNCTAKPAGTVLRNQAYSETLKAMAHDGATAIYEGENASNIVAAVQNDAAVPGDMNLEDLANYDVIERPPVCLKYRGHNICGMGPPSSGGLAVGQILGILENFDVAGAAASEPLDVEAVHLFSQAGRLAFADRGLYVADSDFVTVPVEGMLDKDYLASRAGLITEVDMGLAAPGVPPGDFDPSSPDARAKGTGTSQVSIVDRYGNALSLTTTIEAPFGNGVMVNGFMLNNELTDFSFAATDPTTNLPIANRVEGGKRPRSSMAPTIVFDDLGRVELITGSPGGSLIISFTAQAIMNSLDFGLDPQEAINVPHYSNRNDLTEIETPGVGITLHYDAEALATALKERGHSDPTLPLEDRTVGIGPMPSGLSTIQILREKDDPDKVVLIGGADQRRDGKVGGSDMIKPDEGAAAVVKPEDGRTVPTETPMSSNAQILAGAAPFLHGAFALMCMLFFSL